MYLRVIILTLAISATLRGHMASAFICDPADRLQVTTTLPAATGFYTVLDVNKDVADVDAGGSRCLDELRYLPFALFLPPISRTLQLDPAFPNRLVVNPDFSATLSFTVFDHEDVAVRFSARFDLQSFDDDCDEPKIELRDTCYVPNPGALINPTCWQCWSVVSGTITALPGTPFAGLILSATRFMNQPQFGIGANGKNSHLGISFWFLFEVISFPDTTIPGVRNLPTLPAVPHGDVNIDLLPPPSVSETPQVKGDPHFVGFCSNVPSCRYDFHGESDKVFAIISDRNLQLNARFVDADLRPQKIFKTYLGEIGLRLPSSQVRVGCDRLAELHVIEVDGKELPPMTIRSLDTIDGPATISRDDQDRVTIDLPRYLLKLRFSSSSHSSCHLNMRANYRAIHNSNNYLAQYPPHGVLGQTADPTRNFPAFGVGPQGEGIVEGHWQDYLIQDDDLFGTEFRYSRWDSAEQEYLEAERTRTLRDPVESVINAKFIEDDNDDDFLRHDDDHVVEKSAAVH